MNRPGFSLRRRSQEAFTLVETLAVVAISALIMVPLLGWGLLAIQEQDAIFTRNTDGASIGLLRTYFVRDVASATGSAVDGAATDDCVGGLGAAGSDADTLLRLEGDDEEYVVFNQAASSEGTGLSIWRRECDGTTLMATTEVVDRVEPGTIEVTCSARTGAPVGDCGRIRFKLETEDGETLAMTATVRTGEAVGDPLPPGGTVYVSPDVSIVVNPTTVFRGETITFDASGSSDPGGGSLTHYWDFGDGTSSTDAVATKVYGTLGEFTAVYTATNDDGTPASDYVRITVQNRPPTAVISAPSAGPWYRCQNVTFAANGSNDSGDAPYGGSVAEYHWNYGDGTSSIQTAVQHTRQFKKLVPSGSATLVVVDNDGLGSTAATAPISVVNRAPATPSITANGGTGTITGIVPRTVNFASTASDPDLCAGSDETLSYQWNFGDGGSSTQANPSYTYTTGGSYTATLTVTDGSGVTKTSNSIPIRLNTNPGASFTLNTTSVRVGQLTQPNWITNTSTDPDGHPMTADWTFPNGTPASSSAWNPPQVSFTHNVGGSDTFISATYAVGLTVTDQPPPPYSPGSFVAPSRNITVTGAPAPTNLRKTGDRRQCVNEVWGVCWDYHYWNSFAWNAAAPPINLYQLHVRWDGCIWPITCWNNSYHTTTGTSIELHEHGAGGGNGSDYIQVRARDATINKWGPWSPEVQVSFYG